MALFGQRKKPFVLLPREEREAEIMQTELEAKKATKPVGPIAISKKIAKKLEEKKKRNLYKAKEKKLALIEKMKMEDERLRERYAIEQAKIAQKIREEEEKLRKEIVIVEMGKKKKS